MSNKRWLHIVATIMIASVCGVILGMMLLGVFADADIEASQDDVYETQLPKVVQSSLLMDKPASEVVVSKKSSADAEGSRSGGVKAASVEDVVEIPTPTPIKETMVFPNKAWYFVQAGVFNQPEYAYPITQKIKSSGIYSQMYGTKPARLMAAGFESFRHANDIVKQWSVMGIELYTKELEVKMPSIEVFVHAEGKYKSQQLANDLLAYYGRLADSSYQLLTGNSVDLQVLQSKHANLLTMIDYFLSIEGNQDHQVLLAWKTELELANPFIQGNKQLGKELQKLLLSLFTISDINEWK